MSRAHFRRVRRLSPDVPELGGPQGPEAVKTLFTMRDLNQPATSGV
jgi:hypothetical protein